MLEKNGDKMKNIDRYKKKQNIFKAILLYILTVILINVPNVEGLPVPGVDISPFGAQSVWPNDANLDTILNRMQEAGIEWGRFDLIWWSLCELTQGEYEFISPDYPGYQNWNVDLAISKMKARHIEPFPILCYGNSLYDGGQGPYTAAGRTAFGNYCYAAVDRYKDSVTYWEIWNEPNQSLFWGATPNAAHYAELAKVAAQRIREANPNAIIAGGSTSGIDLGYLNTAFQNGLLDAVDIITIHPYRINSPESINSEISTLRSMISSHTSRDIKIWTGEWGYNTYWSEVTPIGQAKCLSRMMINNLSQDIQTSIWFSTNAFVESSGSDHDPEWGLLDYSYTPRPSFYAMQVLNQRLPAPVKYISDPISVTLSPALSNQRIEVLERGDSHKLTVAIWLAKWPISDSFSGSTTKVILSIPESTELSAYDGLSGDEINLNINRNGDKTELTNFLVMDYPKFLEINMPSLTPTFISY